MCKTFTDNRKKLVCNRTNVFNKQTYQIAAKNIFTFYLIRKPDYSINNALKTGVECRYMKKNDNKNRFTREQLHFITINGRQANKTGIGQA